MSTEVFRRLRTSNYYRNLNYWDNFRPSTPSNINYIDRWLAKAELFDVLSLQNRACILLWDALTNRFIYAADKVGVLPNNMAARLTQPDGVEFWINQYPPEHLEAALLFQKQSFDFCLEHPTEVKKIIMNHNCDHGRGQESVHLLQQARVIETDINFQPILYLGLLSDISHIKKNSTASLVISSTDKTLMWNYNFDTKRLERVPQFTDQENKVLHLLGEGKNTRDISRLLFISPHTVDTHRRNLLAKTNCVDTTALVTYCRMVGLY